MMSFPGFTFISSLRVSPKIIKSNLMCVHHITSWKRFDKIIHIRVTTSHSPNLLYNCREGQMFRKFFQFILVDVWSNQCIEIQIRWCLNQFQTRRTIQYSISPCLDKHHSEHLVRSQKKENLYYHMMMHSLSWTFFRVLNKINCLGPGTPSQDRVRVRAWSSKFPRAEWGEEWPQPFDVAGEEMSWSARWSHLSRPGPIVAFHLTNRAKHGQNMIYKPIQYFCVIWKCS